MEKGTQEDISAKNKNTTGKIYLENSDQSILDKLDALKRLHVFIIQRKPSVDYLGGNVVYEIMDTSKNIIFKASKPRTLSLSTNTKISKLILKNLRNVKVLSVIIESTNNLGMHETEASVYIYPKQKIAHVEKYGSATGAPSFEIFNVDKKTAFTIDLSAKKAGNSILEYEVGTKAEVAANVMAKTGLNYVLSTYPGLQPIEKATLIGVTLSMDLLKPGTRDDRLPIREPHGNQYRLN